MLLTVYGDSLSLPRNLLQVGYSQTYPEVLAADLRGSGVPVNLYNRSIGGEAIRVLWHHFQRDCAYFGRNEAAAAIIQVGIVDCAPRFVPAVTKARIERLPAWLRQLVVRVIRRIKVPLAEKGVFVRETEPQEFRDILRQWLQHARAHYDCVIVVNICAHHPDIEPRSPRLPESIALYNAMIAEIVTDLGDPSIILADVYAAIRQAGIDGRVSPDDGHHITVAGHAIYAALLAETLRRHMPEQRSTAS